MLIRYLTRQETNSITEEIIELIWSEGFIRDQAENSSLDLFLKEELFQDRKIWMLIIKIWWWVRECPIALTEPMLQLVSIKLQQWLRT